MQVEMNLRVIIKDVESVAVATKNTLHHFEWYAKNTTVAYISAHEHVTYEGLPNEVPREPVPVVE